jgi:DNA-binding response OmpR family regulator
MSHILVVDDEPSIVAVVRDRLEREGLSVRAVASGEEALAHVDADPPDLVVLDVMLPGIDGFEVLRRLRSTGHAVPVVVLTARDEDVDKIVGLEMGADDYLVKPFNPRELSARIRAILRRQAEVKALEDRVAQMGAALDEAGPQADAGTTETGGGLHFDHARLLCFLSAHRGQVFSRDVLLDRVWGYESHVDERTVDVHVRRLRVKLAAVAPDTPVILTEWGVGYRLNEEL